jgi:alpha-tubulin suppressor-like RCC1 family protein
MATRYARTLLALLLTVASLFVVAPTARAATAPFKVAIKTSAGSAVPLASVTLTGTVSPAAAGKKVTIQEKSGTTWKTVTTATLSKTSTFSAPVRLDLPARSAVFRASMPAVGVVPAGVSSAVTVKLAYTGPVIRQVDLDDDFACGVTTAGGAICWGSNAVGQLGAGLGVGGAAPAEPVGVHRLSSGVADVAVGENFACALTTAGGVLCWGAGGSGQLGIGRSINSDIPLPVQGLSSGVAAITAGNGVACALTTAGAVQCWGNIPRGSAAPAGSDVPVPVPGLGSGVKSVSSGGKTTCAVPSDGRLLCWGGTVYSYDSADGSMSPQPTPAGRLYRSVILGTNHNCAITTSNGADCWGLSNVNQAGDGSAGYGEVATPTAVAGLPSKVSTMALGGSHSCALVAGALWCFGGGTVGQLANGKKSHVLTPTAVTGLEAGVASIAAGGERTCLVSKAGALMCAGKGFGPPDRLGTASDATKPVAIPAVTSTAQTPTRSDFTAIASGRSHACGLTKAGGVLCWGSNAEGQLGDGGVEPSTEMIQPRGLDSGVVAIDAGGYYTCAVLTVGQVKCWGRDGAGQLGHGRVQGSLLPRPVIGISDAASVSASVVGGLTCAVTKAGAAFCWGDNTNGQLGTGQNASALPWATTAQAVSGLGSDVRSISVGSQSACAVTTAGAVSCWGDNTYGQLGTGVATVGTDSTAPVAVPALSSGVTSVSVGKDYACAVTEAGAVSCWGSNLQSQLSGEGDSPEPRAVVGISDATAVSARAETSCVLRRDGGVACWGRPPLGDGLEGDRTTPQQVRDLESGVLAVSTAPVTQYVLLASGAVRYWDLTTNSIPRTR